MTKLREDWYIDVPWGTLAGISWGEPTNSPVLMVHGYMDSAATFIPMVELMPDTFFYVAVDLPGHGKSDPFPNGVPLTLPHQVEAIRQLVKVMKWKHFMSIAHSMGIYSTCMYNAVFPNQITKMVNLDLKKFIAMFFVATGDLPFWTFNLYDQYYNNYSKLKAHRQTEYTYKEAVDVVRRGRNIETQHAELLMTRNLEHVGGDKYRLTWEPFMKRIVLLPMDQDTLCSLISVNAPPMLNTIASDDDTIEGYENVSDQVMDRLKKNIPIFLLVPYKGSHDHHVVRPKDFINEIIDFLNKEFTKAKL